MSFKMCILFCVLSFFTVAWSFGLNENQINSLVSKQKVYKDIFPNEAIIVYLTEVGYTGDVKQFQGKQYEEKQKQSYMSSKPKEKEFVVNNKTMPEFLILLADNHKKTDSWMHKSFTTYEVKIFVRMFNEQDKNGERHGFLNKTDLIELLNNQLFHTGRSITKIIKEFTDEEPITVLLYLAALLKHKCKYRHHLNKKQIDKCLDMYNTSKKQLDSKKQKALFKDLHIVTHAYKHLLDIKHVRPAAQELEELLVFYSEYCRDCDLTGPVLTNVRKHMLEFSTLYDKNHDGLIDVPLEEVAITQLPNYDVKTFLDEFFPDKARPICAATFLTMKLSKHPADYTKEIKKYNTYA